MLASAAPPITWLSQAKPPQRPGEKSGKSYLLLRRPPILLQNLLPMLELGIGFAVEKNEHFFAGSQRLCNLRFQFLLSVWFGRLQSTEPPFRASGKLPRVCTQGYPLLCGPEPGLGVGRGCRSVLASLIYSST